MAPVALLENVRKWYSGHQEKPPPVTQPTAVLLSMLYVLIYVLPFYLSSKTRPSPALPRDSSIVIRARIRAVTFSCCVTCIATTYLARQNAHLSWKDIIHLYGWWPLHVRDIANNLLLVAMLFVGPLFESAIVESQWRSWVRGGSFVETLSSSIGWRNYVAGPVTEEFVFRSMILALQIFARETPARLVFITPLYFGIAHIHHFYEFKLTHPKVPILPALLRTSFQFGYTSVFGFFASFIFLRTANLPAAIVVHTFCNWMGLPRLWGRVEAPVLPIGPAGDSLEKESSTTRVVHDTSGSLHVMWTLAYYFLLFAGVFGFYRNLWTLTESPNALIHRWS